MSVAGLCFIPLHSKITTKMPTMSTLSTSKSVKYLPTITTNKSRLHRSSSSISTTMRSIRSSTSSRSLHSRHSKSKNSKHPNSKISRTSTHSNPSPRSNKRGVQCTQSLHDLLPEEMILCILSWLTPLEQCKMARSNSIMYQLIRESASLLFYQTFGDEPPPKLRRSQITGILQNVHLAQSHREKAKKILCWSSSKGYIKFLHDVASKYTLPCLNGILNLRTSQVSHSMTPLYLAARQQHIDIVEFLITSPNARINELCGSYSHTISHIAATKGSLGILRVIGHHATVDATSSRKSPGTATVSDVSHVDNRTNHDHDRVAHRRTNIRNTTNTSITRNASNEINEINTTIAATSKRHSRLRWDIDKRDGVNLHSPLMTAILHGHAHCVGYLIECGADVNFMDKNEMSCLYIAAENGHVSICAMLLNHGARIDDTSKAGKTPLFIACDQGYIDVVTLLVGYGANVRLKSSRGKLPLYVAAEKGFKDIVKVLLDHSEVSDLFTMTSYGTTPFFIASKQLDKGVKSLFKRFCIKQQNIKKNGSKIHRVQYIYGDRGDRGKQNGRNQTQPMRRRQMIMSDHADILQISTSDLISEDSPAHDQLSHSSLNSSQSSVQRALQDSQQWLREREQSEDQRSTGPLLVKQRSRSVIGNGNNNGNNGNNGNSLNGTSTQEMFAERLPTPLFAHEMEDFQDAQAQSSQSQRYNFSRYNGVAGDHKPHRYYRLSRRPKVKPKKRLWR